MVELFRGAHPNKDKLFGFDNSRWPTQLLNAFESAVLRNIELKIREISINNLYLILDANQKLKMAPKLSLKG